MKTKTLFGFFILLTLLISLVPLASASTLGVVSNWVVNGQSVSGKTLTVNVGDKVNMITYVTPSDDWVDYNVDVILQNGAKQKIKYLWNIAGVFSSVNSGILSYTPTAAGTYYILSTAYDTVNSQSADILTLIVKNPQVCVPGTTETLSTCWDGSVQQSRTCDPDGMAWTTSPAKDCPAVPKNNAPRFELNPKADDSVYVPLFFVFPQYYRTQGEYFSITAIGKDIDGDKLTFSVSPATGNEEKYPSWINFKDNGDGTATLSGIAPQAKEYILSLKVSDGTDYFFTPIILTIDSGNAAPVINVPGAQEATEETVSTFMVSGSDADGDTLTYEIVNPIFRVVSFDKQTGKVTVNADYDFIDHPYLQKFFNLRFRAYDGKVYSEWKDVSLKILDKNRAPDITNREIPSALDVEEVFDFSVTAVDADQDTLTYTWDMGDGTKLNGAQVSHAYSTIGTYHLKVTAADPYGSSDSVLKDITVTIPVVVPPTLEPIGAKTVREGSTLNLDVQAADGSKIVNYEARELCNQWTCKVAKVVLGFIGQGSLINGASFDEKTGEFIFSPNYDFVQHPDREDNIVMQFRGYNGEAYSGWISVPIEVIDMNRNPVIDRWQVMGTLETDNSLTFNALASDADGDTLTYSWNFGDGSTASGASATHTYTTEGTYTIIITITDAYGGKVTESKTITITKKDFSGCTDPLAVNYDSQARTDDGSCIYIVKVCIPGTVENLSFCRIDGSVKEYRVCDADGMGWTNHLNVCPTPKVFGCMDAIANNYNPLATEDDGSCTYDIQVCVPGSMESLTFCDDGSNKDWRICAADGMSWILHTETCTVNSIKGCTDSLAWNYNPFVTEDDGSCLYVAGCMDVTANNYNPAATKDDGSCTYDVQVCVPGNMESLTFCDNGSAKEWRICNADGLGWTTHFETCVVITEVLGCTDLLANNYNAAATKDDGSCTYITVVSGCTNPEAINYDENANANDGSCILAKPGVQFMKIQPSSEVVVPGQSISFDIKVKNNGNIDLKDLEVSVFSYDLGFKNSVGNFNLGAGKSKGVKLYSDIPYDAQSGEYLLEFTFGNDQYHDVAYRQVIVE